MNNLVENKYGHGGIALHPIQRKLRKWFRPKIALADVPFDWITGYNIEDTIGEIPVKNQGQSFSCGGQAGSYFLTIQQRLKGLDEDCSAKSVYSPISYPKGGTTINALETEIGAHGATLESEVPSYQLGNPPSELWMIDKSWQTPSLTLSAYARAGFTPVSVPLDMDSIANAIKSNGGVIWEIQGQNNGTWLSPIPKPPSKKNSNPLWTHFMCGIGAKDNKLVFLNSWGMGCGDKGKQYFDLEYLSSGFVIECFTFIKDSLIKPLPSNDSIWASVWAWFR